MLWPVACLSGRSEALLLCVLDQALNQDASNLLRGSPTAIGLYLAVSAASPVLKIGVISEVFHDWGTLHELKAVLKSICKQGSKRYSGAGSASVGTSLA